MTVPGVDYFDDTTQEFVQVGEYALELEHSLVSLSKWEAIHEKPFLSKDQRSTEETLSYVNCMSLKGDIPPEVLQRLSEDNAEAIQKYLAANMTATTFNEPNNPSPTREIITNEVIYSWMVALQIPLECENWHLNRLITLIKVVNAKSSKPKPMSNADRIAQQRAINRKRREELGTTG